MSKPKEFPSPIPDYIFDDEELGISHRDYERSGGRRAVRQGIDDYFERKQINEIEDWFGSME